MTKKEKYKYIFYSKETLLFYIGLVLILLFVLIFLTIGIVKGKLDYISFFFHNLKANLFLTILTGFHVGMLAIGILLVFISFFRMSPIILVYSDRFEIFELLQRKKIVKYQDIKSLTVSINYIKRGFFSSQKKECSVLINNPIFNFFLCYEINGYFDEVNINNKEEEKFLLRRCLTKREIVKNILLYIKSCNKIKIPFLPE